MSGVMTQDEAKKYIDAMQAHENAEEADGCDCPPGACESADKPSSIRRGTSTVVRTYEVEIPWRLIDDPVFSTLLAIDYVINEELGPNPDAQEQLPRILDLIKARWADPTNPR
jgi:hypothetical protein